MSIILERQEHNTAAFEPSIVEPQSQTELFASFQQSRSHLDDAFAPRKVADREDRPNVNRVALEYKFGAADGTRLFAQMKRAGYDLALFYFHRLLNQRTNGQRLTTSQIFEQTKFFLENMSLGIIWQHSLQADTSRQIQARNEDAIRGNQNAELMNYQEKIGYLLTCCFGQDCDHALEVLSRGITSRAEETEGQLVMQRAIEEYLPFINLLRQNYGADLTERISGDVNDSSLDTAMERKGYLWNMDSRSYEFTAPRRK